MGEREGGGWGGGSGMGFKGQRDNHCVAVFSSLLELETLRLQEEQRRKQIEQDLQGTNLLY